MDQQGWKKVEKIVDQALQLEEEERPAFIKNQCSDNQELRLQVTELLKAIEKSEIDDFLEDTDTIISKLAGEIAHKKQASYASSLIGSTIGNYKIIELIGHGGMGSVFLAERADEAYDRNIALKVMRRGMDTPSNIARFKRERNLLARLDHPNIARLLDGGVTPDGLPYLVMEYVDGLPLLDYCDKNNLSISERIALFESVCEAVQHAHRNTIIHRDLKPSNIYVSDDGTVKVLDFGIAKLIESGSTGSSYYQTQTGSRILTFGYAAPEQVENEPITTATDSYTLGILLYELLVGSHPFDLENKNLTSIEKIVRHKNPLTPSTKFEKLPASEKQKIADQRRTSPSSLLQKIQGDLDAIVCKALRKEPEARYNTVDQMLEDLSRYYQSRPLIAQSDTFRYRFGKFIKRNCRPLIAIILIIAAAIGFGSYHINQVTEERNIAERERQKVETVKSFLVDIFGSANPGSANFEGKDISAQQILVNGQKQIGESLQNQPDVYIEILVAVGDALSNIGAFEEAEKSYNQALSKVPKTSNPLINKARIYAKLGDLKSTWTKGREALAPAREAQKVLKSIENPPPALEASIFSLLGRVHTFIENYGQANSNYEKADSIYVSTGMTSNFDYIKMLSDYGKLLIYNSDFKKAERVLKQSTELHQDSLSNPTITLAKSYKFLGWTHRDMGNFSKSSNYFLKSIDLYHKLTGEESVSAALPKYHLSINYTLSGQYEKAENLAKEVLSIYKKQLDPTNDHIQRPKKYIAVAKFEQNELAEAKNILHNLINERTKLRGEGNIGLAEPYSHLAVIAQKKGDYKKAISLLEKSIRIYKKELGKNNIRIARAMIKIAAVYRDMGKYDLARKYFEKTESIHRQVLPEKNHQNGDFYFEYGKLMQDINKPQQTQRYFQKSYDIYQDIFGAKSNRTKEVQSYLEQVVNKKLPDDSLNHPTIDQVSSK